MPVNTIVGSDGGVTLAGPTTAQGTLGATGALDRVRNTPTAGQFGALAVVASASEMLLTTTAATTVVTFTPPANGNYLIVCYFRVVTATTTVTVQYQWNDAGGAQTNTPVNAVAEPVGSYSLAPFALAVTTAGPVRVVVTAATANQVYVSAAILAL